MTRWSMALALLFIGHAAQAHKPSDSYLTLIAHGDGTVDVAWHVALRDLDSELNLDADEDGRLTWREVRTRWPELIGYTQAHLGLTQRAGPCSMVANSLKPPALATHTDGRYAALQWQQRCPSLSDRVIQIQYKLFALTDPTHRGIVRLRATAGGQDDMKELGVVVMGGDRPAYRMSLALPRQDVNGSAIHEPQAHPAAESSAVGQAIDETASQEPGTEAGPSPSGHLETLRRFLREGVVHIVAGIDHVLFLVSLMLVAVWTRTPPQSHQLVRHGWMQGWSPQPTAWATAREVGQLVTAFTVAHSITLGLAAYGVLSPPSRWVESLIAASVAIAVLDNIHPILPAPRWMIVFAFGLVHGFGFAGALQDIGLEGENLAWPLLGFNLGVELGQLMLVALILPPAYLLRRTRFYRYGVVLPASLLIAVLSLIWLIERAGDVVILGWAV